MATPLTPTRIKKWRHFTGRNREWLAEECGVSPRTVEAWEQGLRNPSGPARIVLENLMRRKPLKT